MDSLPSIDLSVFERLKNDPEFRQKFFLAESSAKIAQQLINLRKRRKLNQTQVAEKIETGQPAISRVESADYCNWSFNTLRKLAAAMDARIRVLIEPAEDVLSEYAAEDQTEIRNPLPQRSSTSQAIVRGVAPPEPEERVERQIKITRHPKGAVAVMAIGSVLAS